MLRVQSHPLELRLAAHISEICVWVGFEETKCLLHCHVFVCTHAFLCEIMFNSHSLSSHQILMKYSDTPCIHLCVLQFRTYRWLNVPISFNTPFILRIKIIFQLRWRYFYMTLNLNNLALILNKNSDSRNNFSFTEII